MATHTRRRKKEPFHISSFALTSTTETTLTRISQDATDVIGRRVSDSAIIRALLRHIERQPLSWVRGQLYPLLETEMNTGVLWGKKKN